MNQSRISVDHPISSSVEDRLERASEAQRLVAQILKLDVARGLVVSVMAPWGYGKTSFVNLMRERFEQEQGLTVIEFNPWMFSGAPQLTDTFFRELAAELRVDNRTRFESVANGLDQYGDLLGTIASVLGPLGAAAVGGSRLLAKSAARIDNLRRGGARQLHEKIADALRLLDAPVVVVIDDIDRLSTEEIRDIFKLVRLTASFPNLVYLLAFDRERIERALDELNVPGRAYLEKIVQLGFDLPIITRRALQGEIISELNGILVDVPYDRFDEDRWPDIFVEIVEPLVTNMRDVTRLSVSARPALVALGNDVEITDILALEAVRVFLPQVFSRLGILMSELTQVSGFSYTSRDISREKALFEGLIGLGGDHATVVRSLLLRVFPATRQYLDNSSFGPDSSQQWRSSHRVAHIDWLSLYMARVAPPELRGFRMAERALSVLDDRDALAKLFGAVPDDELEDTVEALAGLSTGYSIDAVVPASIVLENLISRIPPRAKRGVFDFNRPEIYVARVVRQLLTKLEDEQARNAAVQVILPEIETLSSKYEFISMAGHREGSGHKLITEDLWNRLESDLELEIMSGIPSHPGKEWQATAVYHFAASRRRQPVLPSVEDADLIRSLLQSAKTTRTSQAMDSRRLRSQDVLAWELLIDIAGSEDAIRSIVETLRAIDGDTPFLDLVDRYLSGWRPSDRDDEEW